MSKPARPRVITEPLGGSALSLAVQARRLPAGIQPWWPKSRAEWKVHVHRVRSEAAPGWYDALRPALASSGTAQKRIERAAKGGVVVTTGQQAGLFGGPLYSLAKALSALSLADAIEAAFGVPTAAVFWACTDDGDFLEASVAHVADADGLREIRLSERPPAGTPMSGLPMSDVGRLLDQLRKACGSAAHADYFDVARDAFTRGRTLGSAYASLLRGLLEPLGVSVLDSSHAACRMAGRPALTDALKGAAEIARASADRAAAIRNAGFEPQVVDDRGLSLVFAIEKGVRRRLTVEEAPKVARTLGADSSPLIPNVLLRPVLERQLLPTVAYAAGPGELAYFAQTSAVAAALKLEKPVGVARWSCTIIEPFVARALSRLGVKYQQVAHRHALERRLAAETLPKSVAGAWKRLQKNVAASIAALGKSVASTKLMPPEVIEGLGRSLNHRLARGERRLLAAAKRRDERTQTDVRVAADALFPSGERQERVLNFIPMLARGGDDLLNDMLKAARLHAGLLIRGRAKRAVSR